MTHSCNCTKDDVNWEKVLSFITRNESPASHPICRQPTQDYNPHPPLMNQVKCSCGCMNADQSKDSIMLQNSGVQLNYCGALLGQHIAGQSCHCSCRLKPKLRPNLTTQPSSNVTMQSGHNMTQHSSCEMAHHSIPNMASLSRHSIVIHSSDNSTPHSGHGLGLNKKATQQPNCQMASQLSCPTMAQLSCQSLVPHMCQNAALHSQGLSHHLVAQTSHSVGLQPGIGMSQPLQVRYNFSRIICSSSEPTFSPLPRCPSQPNFSVQSNYPPGQNEECQAKMQVRDITGTPGHTTDSHAATTSSVFSNAASIERKQTIPQGSKSVPGTPVLNLHNHFVLLDGQKGETLTQRRRAKKPLNAFLLFMRENRAEVRKELGISNSAVVNMALGEKWNKMSPEEQAQYYEQAYYERRRYYSDRGNSDICDWESASRSGPKGQLSDLDDQSEQLERKKGNVCQYIKKPPNAFLLFTRENRSSVVEKLRITNNATVNEILGQMWKSLSNDEQAKYYELSNNERIMHQTQYPEWSTKDNYGKRRRRRTFTLPLAVTENSTPTNTDDDCKHQDVDAFNGT